MLVFTYVDQGLQLLIQQNLRTHVELWFYKQKYENIINFQERYLQWGKRQEYKTVRISNRKISYPLKSASTSVIQYFIFWILFQHRHSETQPSFLRSDVQEIRAKEKNAKARHVSFVKSFERKSLIWEETAHFICQNLSGFCSIEKFSNESRHFTFHLPISDETMRCVLLSWNSRYLKILV